MPVCVLAVCRRQGPTPIILRMTSARKILLGVTGGIAAYKSPDLVRRLIERGADVQVVMSRGAPVSSRDGFPYRIACWNSAW